MCHSTILENSGTLKSVPHSYKNQQMRHNAVDNYSHTLKFVPDCYMAQKMYDKVFDKYLNLYYLYLFIFLTEYTKYISNPRNV